MVDLQTGGAWRNSDTYVFKPTSATASNRATADGADRRKIFAVKGDICTTRTNRQIVAAVVSDAATSFGLAS